MHSKPKILATAALLLLAGPFSLAACAQDYVEQEAARAAGAQPGPTDPYAPRGAQSYPATSYGVSNAPPATAVAPGSATAVAPVTAPPAAQSVQDQNLGALLIRIQQLEQQVMQLNGKLEEQANELNVMREQNLQRYTDLDKRLSAGAVGGAAATTADAPATIVADDAIPAAGPTAGTAPVAEQVGEAEAYRAAYALVQSQKFDQAVQAFQQFQRNYPAGKYAPNAYYWLGELYLVIQPQDLESSRQAFAMMLSLYPDNAKAPDALYKLGKVQFMKGNRDKAREYMDEVISRYGSTTSSAVKLAKDFLAQNY
ncbi:MAG: tol-pal system protein YbgF [Pseudomonadales bacterium]|nr:tol-pal system protein YbgF [Halioglobus sp.]MCP5130535.1 tol-pal system protein YbgF [Pseudomonadales bacterium]